MTAASAISSFLITAPPGWEHAVIVYPICDIIYVAVFKTVAHGHIYKDLFALLPAERQADILRIAGERIGPSALASDHMSVLADLGSNFVKLRYPYEKYGHMTQQEYAQVGATWIASGANTSDADYRYHPEELFGLTFALQQVADAC